MKRVFVSTPKFLELWDECGLGDDEMRILEHTLLEEPERGVVLKGTGGIRKVRMGVSGRGKRGGARVLYKDFQEHEQIFLLYVLRKNECEDLTPKQREQLASAVRAIKVALDFQEKDLT